MATAPQIIKVSQTVQLPSPAIPNVSPTTAGLAPTAPNDVLQELNGAGLWGYQAPWKRYNAIRNPEMIVTQRGTSGGAAPAGYTIDGWRWEYVTSTWGASFTQIAAAIPSDPSGNNWYPYLPYAYRLTTSPAQTSFTALQYSQIVQIIEGNMATLLKDNPTSLSFLVRASATGTFTIALRDSLAAYSYTTPVTITAANTWQRVTLPNIPAFPSAGTFPNGAGVGYSLAFNMGAGSTYTSPADNVWLAGNYIASTHQTNLIKVTGTFDFTAVQHEPNPVCTPYIGRDLQTETNLNYRYLWVVPAWYLGWVYSGNWTAGFGRVKFPVPMRAAPSLTGATFSPSSGSAGTPTFAYNTPTMGLIYNSDGNWAPTAFNTNWVLLNTPTFTAEF